MKVIVSNPGTGVFILETVKAYAELGLLKSYYTTFASNKDIPYYNFLVSGKLKIELDRRSVPYDVLSYLKTNPWKEILRTLSSKFLNEKITDDLYEWSEYSFDRWVASNLDKSVDIVHCYEHSSLETIKRAKELGIFVVYEQPSQHHSYLTPIIRAQFKQYPNLGDIQTSLLTNEKSEYRNRRRDDELALADLILCNSTFTKSTLVNASIDESKILVLPLGFPEINMRKELNSQKIRFIYAGTSNIRKGIHLLLEVWKECFENNDDVELYIVGRYDLPLILKEQAPENVVFIDSIPRSELLNSFCDADVLIVPTLADGFGMVITEAMSRGVCVMCTHNSAGPDLIEHGKDGLLFPANDKNALIDMLKEWSLKKDELNQMGKKAIEKAKSYSWTEYRKKLTKLIIEKFDARKK